MKTLIIAEAGVNHNGCMENAKEMIRVAKKAGADFVKFQTFKATELATAYAQKAEYQKANSKENESQIDMLKKLEISYESHIDLINYCNQIGIKFLSTGFDIDSVNMLNKLNIDFFKIPSGEINNIPFLRNFGRFEKPIVLSTGMSTMEEIRRALKTLIDSGVKKKHITVLHCNSEYPTPLKDVNLNAMIAIKKEFNIDVGYSDHTIGFETSIAAVAMGAKIIEKHFTLDVHMEGPDHKASLSPDGLCKMINSIRNVEVLLGSKVKSPSESEAKNIQIARKSIVAKKTIKSGELFNEKNLTTKRPGIGISPIHWDKIIGTKATKDYLRDQLIEM